jgi:hypothetical protein
MTQEHVVALEDGRAVQSHVSESVKAIEQEVNSCIVGDGRTIESGLVCPRVLTNPLDIKLVCTNEWVGYPTDPA